MRTYAVAIAVFSVSFPQHPCDLAQAFIAELMTILIVYILEVVHVKEKYDYALLLCFYAEPLGAAVHQLSQGVNLDHYGTVIDVEQNSSNRNGEPHYPY